MTAIAYNDIAQAIRSRLLTSLAGQQNPMPQIVVEEPFKPVESFVGIYLATAAPGFPQSLAAGKKSLRTIRFDIWCWRFAMSNADAFRLRDSLVGDVEVALMIDPTFGGTVQSSWLAGGTFLRADDPQQLGRFLAGGEVVLMADAFATTT